MLAPFGALLDPELESSDFGGGEGRLVGGNGRHELARVGGGDAGHEAAGSGIAGDDGGTGVGGAGAADGGGGVPEVEPEAGHASAGVLSVATEALVREDGQDLTAEVHRLRRQGGETSKEPSHSIDRHTP